MVRQIKNVNYFLLFYLFIMTGDFSNLKFLSGLPKRFRTPDVKSNPH